MEITYPIVAEVVQELGTTKPKMRVQLISADGNIELIRSNSNTLQWEALATHINNLHFDNEVLRAALASDEKKAAPKIDFDAALSGEQQKVSPAATGHKQNSLPPADNTGAKSITKPCRAPGTSPALEVEEVHAIAGHPHIQYKITKFDAALMGSEKFLAFQANYRLGAVYPHRDFPEGTRYEIVHVGIPSPYEEKAALQCPLCYPYTENNLIDNRKAPGG